VIRARVKPRRYDSKRGCYVYDVSFKTGVELTPRTFKVAEAFGLGLDDEKEQTLLRDFEVRLHEGDVVYITGESGSGKSILLRALREDLGEEAVDISEITVDTEKPIIDTIGATFRDALSLLSRVGLNDAYLFLRRYPELSDGQKYRYRIAKLIDSGKKFWLADEFCSTLDRTTAAVVAYNIQKQARRSGATLIVATSHTDLAEDLNPSTTIRKGWGEQVTATYAENREAPTCTAARDITIREGTRQDYARLSALHYRDARLPVPLKIYAAEKNGETVGVIAYSYPSIRAAGRKKAVGYSPTVEELNRDWMLISRVIVHPLYRTTGLGARLIRDTFHIVGRRHVELIAVMAEYNPFAEKAGMTLIQITRPHPSIADAVQRLRDIGFDTTRLGSRAHNLKTIQNTGAAPVIEALLHVNNVYYKRVTSSSNPYVTRDEAAHWLNAQTPERLARCLQNLAVLNQSKAYLYCSRAADGCAPGAPEAASGES